MVASAQNHHRVPPHPINLLSHLTDLMKTSRASMDIGHYPLHATASHKQSQHSQTILE